MKMHMLGSDTEVFLRDKSTGSIIPGHPGLIPGTKEQPVMIGSYAGIQLDNVLAEVTFPPSKGSNEWIRNVTNSREEVSLWLSDRGIKPVYIPSYNFKARELATAWGGMLGCKPDHAADISDPCEDVKAQDFATLRTGSGHIHISLKAPAPASEILQKVRILDLVIGAPLALYNNGSERRTMYGRAGRFRFKPEYPGFEYRTPDNYWYGHFNDAMLDNMYSYIHQVINSDWNTGYLQWINSRHTGICHAINSGDKKLIRQYLDDNPFGCLPYPKASKDEKINSTAKEGIRFRATKVGATPLTMDDVYFNTGGTSAS